MASIRTMTMADYDGVIGLLKTTPGVSFRDADLREATARYLERNPGLSFVAEHERGLVGFILSGHDGRRGYLQHLGVDAAHRRSGLGSALVSACVAELKGLGIIKSHIDVLNSNAQAQAFWEQAGWHMRSDIKRFSFISSGSTNA